jgi:hypothetical protein
MQESLYIVVTNTYVNIGYDLFTATQDNKLFRIIRRASVEYISEVNGDYRGRDRLRNARNFVCTHKTEQLITHFSIFNNSTPKSYKRNGHHLHMKWRNEGGGLECH